MKNPMKRFLKTIQLIMIKSFVCLLPDNLRRMIFLVSLYDYVFSKGEDNLEELNKALKLVNEKNSRSLLLPKLFSKVLWEDTHISSLEDIRNLRNELHSKGLKFYHLDFLGYGRNIDIIGDLKILESHYNKVSV